jgi:hypothetical protein
MIELSTIRDFVAIFGVIAGFSYYVITVRNQKKARQAQLMSGLHETYRSPEFRKMQLEVLWFDCSNFNEFNDKYGPEVDLESYAKWQSVMAFFNGIGILLKKDMLDINLVDELLASMIFATWNKMGSIILEWREWEKENFPNRKRSIYPYYHGFEYVYNELMKIEGQTL